MRERLRELQYVLSPALIRYPALVVQVLVLATHPSWQNSGLAALSLLFSLVLWEGVVGAVSGKKMRDVTAHVAKFPNSRFLVIEPEEYASMLTPAMRAALFRGAFDPETERRFVGMFVDVKTNVCVIVGKEDPPCECLTAYQSLMGTAFIFLPDPPEAMTAYQKYAFLHELGHTSKRAASGLEREIAKHTWVWNLIWVTTLASWNGRAAAALALIVLAQAAFRFEWDLWPEAASNAALKAEIEADRFALQGLTQDELERLERQIVDQPLVDSRLTNKSVERGNLFRNFMLLREIETIRKNGAAPERPPMEMMGPEMFWRNLLTLVGIAAIGQNVTTPKLWAVTVITVVLSLTTRITLRAANGRRRWLESVIEGRRAQREALMTGTLS